MRKNDILTQCLLLQFGHISTIYNNGKVKLSFLGGDQEMSTDLSRKEYLVLTLRLICELRAPFFIDYNPSWFNLKVYLLIKDIEPRWKWRSRLGRLELKLRLNYLCWKLKMK